MAHENQHDLELLIRSRIPIIVAETPEETQTRDLFAQAGQRIGWSVQEWSVARGLQNRVQLSLVPVAGENPFADYSAAQSSQASEETPSAPPLSDPVDVLRHIAKTARPSLFLLLDFHPYLSDATVIRHLKEIALEYEHLQATLVLISHQVELPEELRSYSAKFSPQLPSPQEIEEIIREEAKNWADQTQNQVRTTRSVLEQITRNLTGLAATDVRRLVRVAICDDGAITESDLPEVMAAKFRLLDRQGALAYAYDAARYSDLAGFDRLKKWIMVRREPFLHPLSHSDIPKGVLLLGVQGCGKSLAAKMVAGAWGVPLLRLDMGGLYNKYVGETEKNLREALHTAELMAPCVLWMDELEKGISVGESDDGVSRRLLGTLLTWLSEKQKAVFLVATSNEIASLPPELIRKGRMDEIFFVDLPGKAERRDIFAIHLQKRDLASEAFDLDALAEASEGFNGSEIEQAIVAGIYLSRQEASELNQAHLLAEIQQTRPLSVVMEEPIAHLRQWASGRTVPAH
jgi:ATP-dependent 26S proteasome regulatory subunit